MAYIEWSDQLSINNFSVDTEHKNLVNIINNLHEAMGKGEGHKVVGRILEKLVLYTKTHFKNEEKLMEKSGYPGLAVHRTEHQKFVEEIQTLQENFKKGSITITINLLNYLKDWLVDHIQGSDKKFGEMLSAAA